MGRIERLAAAAVLWAAAAASSAAGPMGVADARHLLTRTGFAPSAAELRQWAGLARAEAVDRLLDGVRTEPVSRPDPAVVRYVSPLSVREMSDSDRTAFALTQREHAAALRGWWLREMRDTPSPLTERLTLFWHNHFVSGLQKVRSPALMYRQNLTLRRHAAGDFAALLHEVARDPAMLVYLDGVTSREGEPNENFARELFELFTLGEGRYTELDVREAARAFTGWSIDRDDGSFTRRRLWRDRGEKTIFGQRGRFDGDDVIDLLLARPETAQTIVSKLWREFVSPEPDAVEVGRLAERFRVGGWQLRPLLRALLLSDAFWAAGSRASLVKSPVELVIGSLRQLEVEAPDMLPFALVTRQLGQDLFAPPNVRGWPGGAAWIDAGTLLARRQYLERLLLTAEGLPRGVLPPPGVDLRARMLRAMLAIQFDPQRLRGALDSARLEAAGLLLPRPPAHPQHGSLLALLHDPAYQLK